MIITDLLYNDLSVFANLTAGTINANSIILSGYDFVKRSDDIYTTLSENSSVNWNYQGSDIKSLSSGWESAYTTLCAFSSYWAAGANYVQYINWNDEDDSLQLTGGNTVYLSAIYDRSKNYSDSKFLSISGGQITGDLHILSSLKINTSLEVGSGNLGLYSNNDKVGINTKNPNESLTVIGSISSNNIIFDKTGDSRKWNSVHTNVLSNSSKWDSIYTSVSSTSSKWDSVYTTVLGNSSKWESIYDSIEANLNWDSVYTTVLSNSSNWDSTYTSVKDASSSWEDVTTQVQANSSSWEYYKHYFRGSFSYSSFFPLNYTLNDIVLNDKPVYNDFLDVINKPDNKLYICIKELPDIYGFPAPIDPSGNYMSEYWKLLETDSFIYGIGSSAYTTVLNNSSNWDNSIPINYSHSNFLPLSGGKITSNVLFLSSVTILGNLSATGTQTFSNTVFSTTTSLCVIHVGAGTAFYVGNDGNADIASFYDIDKNVEVLHIGGLNSLNPNVGVKVSNPNKDFTVNGEISSNSVIYDINGNSTEWNSVYSSVNSVSSNWDSVYTTVSSNSANWDNSIPINYSHSNFLPLSGGTVDGNVSILSGISVFGNSSFVGDVSISGKLTDVLIDAGLF